LFVPDEKKAARQRRGTPSGGNPYALWDCRRWGLPGRVLNGMVDFLLDVLLLAGVMD